MRFGLIIHTGTPKAKSKTEYIYVPGISRTKDIIEQHIKKHGLPEPKKTR